MENFGDGVAYSQYHSDQPIIGDALSLTTQQVSLLKLLLGSVCISFSPIFIRIADVNPDIAGFYRMFFACCSLFILFLLRRARLNITKRPMILLISGGIFLSIDFMFWHRSINLIGPGLSTLLGNFQIFFTVLFSWLFFKEKVSSLFLLAVLLALTGLLFITGIDFPALSEEIKTGILFALITALLYSFYILSMKRAMHRSTISSISAMLVISTTSTLFLATRGLTEGISFAIIDSKSLLALAGVGIISTTLGWSMITAAMKTVSATVVSLVLLLQPALSFLWDILFFNRLTSSYEYLGITMILLAIYFGSLRKVEKQPGNG